MLALPLANLPDIHWLRALVDAAALTVIVGPVTLAWIISPYVKARYASKKQLRMAKDQLEMILNAAGEGVYGIDMDGNCTFINPTACRLLGQQPAAILGLNAHEIMHHTLPDGSPYLVHDCHIFQASREGKITTVTDEVFWRANGSSFPVEYTSTPIDVDGKIKGAVVVFRDITEARNLQAQLVQSSKLATLGEMATGVAHELNQPLNIIRLAAGNVIKRHKNDNLELDYMVEKLERIAKQTVRATEIINHMRIFGRKAEKEPHPVDLSKAARDALFLVNGQLRLAGIDVTVDMAEPSPVIIGHATQVEQVCLNLLNNARDAIVSHREEDPDGDVAARITISTAGNDMTDEAVLSIQDTGGGIPPDVIDRIFEPFYTTKEVGKGTGLGLSISYGIIAEMKGRITAKNTEYGTEFVINLPLAAGGANAGEWLSS